jgi:hypothetical protein
VGITVKKRVFKKIMWAVLKTSKCSAPNRESASSPPPPPPPLGFCAFGSDLGPLSCPPFAPFDRCFVVIKFTRVSSSFIQFGN